MGLDFDVLEFCKKLRTSKQPPYECPVAECGKTYRSLCGLQYHLVNFDHTSTPVGRKKSRGSHNSRPTTSTVDLLSSPTREGLTYAEAQKMVEFEVDGRVTRVSIFDPLPLISKEEFESKYGSIKENTSAQTLADARQSTGQGEEKVKLPEPNFTVLDSYNIPDAPPRPNAYIRFIERSAEEMDGEVEYDMDEEDCAWLSIINERRAAAGLSDVPVDTFELLMDRLEKESYFQSCGKGGDGVTPTVIDDDAVCCICMDGECQNSNVILFCDMCNLAVHQDCYGVPYIPEGQWLCRRCLQSPSRAVDCVLCPNNGGAFKQTDRGHWAHVVCALWIPEVRFANTVFLEPIDSIETIPPARWKLTCYICKQRGVGACIQCHKTNCYAAFHVTCAQQAGLYMKMDTVRDSHAGNGLDPGPVLVQKTAYCDAHTPGGVADSETRARGSTPSSSKQSPAETSREESRQKMKKARRMLAKKRSSVPVISIPTIPPDRIQEIASLVNIPKKSQLIQKLIAYWTLKRQFRNGVPLLRRLQSSHLARRDDPRPLQEVGELYRQLKYWQCLRQDLERARLLCELVRKREKLKKELCKVKELCMEVELQPFVCFLRRLLDLIQSKDTGEIFSEPVDLSQVPDYSDVVNCPMDISTMRTKVDNFEYPNLDVFEKDFNLMISNCMAYNSKETIFYKAAIKMKEQGGALLKQARKDLEANGFDPATGLLIQEGEVKPPDDEALVSEIESEFATVINKMCSMPNAERLAKLMKLEDKSQNLSQGGQRGKWMRLIKTKITKLRRKMALCSENVPRIQPGSGTSKAANKTSKETSLNVSESTDTATETLIGPAGPSAANVKPKSGRGRKKGWRKHPVEEPEEPPATSTPSSTSAVTVNNTSAVNASSTSDSSSQQEGSGLISATTPSKQIIGSEQSQPPTSVSPSGVNRRTAVLFTRKAAAAAFRKPESHTGSHNSSATSGGSTQVPNRRRVGRPRKNLETSTPEKNPLLAAVGENSELSQNSSLISASPLPCSESFRVYRSGGDIPVETDEETQSDSTCSSCSTTDGSSGTSEDGGSSSIDLQQQHGASGAESSGGEEEGGSGGSLEPLDLVWAKCRGYPWYPALIIDPKMPRTGYLHNGVPIPAPPTDVLALASNYAEPVYLVLFFDTKRTWQWLPRNKLEPLGVTTEVDQAKLTESRKPTDRKAVRKAYQEAMLHHCQVTEGQGKKGRAASAEVQMTTEES